MKLTSHANKLETNMVTESQDFSVDDAGKIIEMLRHNVYQHPLRTLVQEYMSNGRDAMRENNSKKRMIVTIPNRLNPIFKVRDFGPGISPARMTNIFLKYGATTKSGDNKQTGGFGIGAKSAWAYTDSFTIISITGGVKRTYIAHIGKNVKGSLDLLSEDASTEPTGTEIQIAIKPSDCGTFKDAVFRACHFWTAKEMPEFKGVTAQEIPTRIEGLRIGDMELWKGDIPSFLGLDNSYYNDTLSLIIDGIPYPVGEALLDKVSRMKTLLGRLNSHLAIHIGNGVVEIPLSREQVADSEFTRNALTELTKVLTQELTAYIWNEFEKAETDLEWFKTYSSLSKMVEVDDYGKRGKYTITNHKAIESTKFEDFSILMVGANQGRRGRGGWKRIGLMCIPLDKINHILYLDNPAETMVTQNRRIKQYLETNKGIGQAILLMPMQKNAPVNTLAKVNVTLAQSKKSVEQVAIDLGAQKMSTLPFTVPPRQPRATRDRNVDEFTRHEFSSHGKHPRSETLANLMADGGKFLYIDFAQLEKYSAELMEVADFLEDLGYTACALTKSSIDTVSGCANFIPYEKWKSGFKPDSKAIVAALDSKAENKKSMEFLAKATTKIKDKVVAKALEQYKAIEKSTAGCPPPAILKLVSKEVKEFTDLDAELTKLLKTVYILVRPISNDYETRGVVEVANEIVNYINGKV